MNYLQNKVAIVTGASSGIGAATKAAIVRIDIVGTAASARVDTDNVSGFRFTDFFNLLKVEGKWTIVSKIYHTQRRRSKRVLTHHKRLVSENLELMRRILNAGTACMVNAHHLEQAERAGVRMEARQGQDNGEYRRAWFTTAGPLGHGIN